MLLIKRIYYCHHLIRELNRMPTLVVAAFIRVVVFRVHLHPYRCRVSLEQNGVNRDIVTHRHRIKELQHLQQDVHLFILIVVQPRARSIRPDEYAVGTKKAFVIGAVLDTGVDAQH